MLLLFRNEIFLVYLLTSFFLFLLCCLLQHQPLQQIPCKCETCSAINAFLALIVILILILVFHAVKRRPTSIDKTCFFCCTNTKQTISKTDVFAASIEPSAQTGVHGETRSELRFDGAVGANQQDFSLLSQSRDWLSLLF